jgi:hypothetical protein
LVLRARGGRPRTQKIDQLRARAPTKINELHAHAVLTCSSNESAELHPLRTELAVQVNFTADIVDASRLKAHTAFANFDRFASHKLIAHAAANLEPFADALEEAALQRLLHAVDVNAIVFTSD